MYALKTDASFDAAHFLSDYNGKCENLHGHRWKVVAHIQQQSLATSGEERDMVTDFARFKAALRAICAGFDHTFIVEEGSLKDSSIQALESETFKLLMVPWRTTAENFARNIAEQLAEKGFDVARVEVYETPKNCAVYMPE